MALFQWGPSGEAMTPQEVERRRLMAMQAQRTAQARPVNNVLDGLSSLVDSWSGYRANVDATAAEQAGLEGARSKIAALLGGGGSTSLSTMGGGGTVDYVPPVVDGGGAFPASLIETESGGNWNALNNETGAGGIAGHGGRLQFGGARLQDAANAGVIGAMSPQQFAQASPEVQQAVERWHFSDIDRQAHERGLDRYIGQNVGGVTVTQDAIRSMAHLGGIGGAERFIESGGQYNPSDSFGTSLADYGQRHGGAGGTSLSTMGGGSVGGGGGNIAELLALSADPWVAQQYGGVVQALMGQEMAAQERAAAMNDPLRQLQIQQAQVDLAQSLNGGSSALPADIQSLQWRAEQAGLQPNTPEYQTFVLNGGRTQTALPAAFVALDQQAQAAGFSPGSPEYENFMATRGAGLVTAAQEQARTGADRAAAAPTQMSNAQTALQGIAAVRNSPYLDRGTGLSSLGNRIPGTGGYGFASQVEQLKGGAFLTAIQQLSGMGALSNAEGATATAAVARLDAAQSKEDFLKALDDYEAIVRTGMARAQGNMPQAPQAPSAPAAPAPPPGWVPPTSVPQAPPGWVPPVNVPQPPSAPSAPAAPGSVLKWNPQTGAFE